MSQSVEGETIYTGFLQEACLDQGKQLLTDNLARWNVGTSPIIENLVSSISSRLHEPLGRLAVAWMPNHLRRVP